MTQDEGAIERLAEADSAGEVIANLEGRRGHMKMVMDINVAPEIPSNDTNIVEYFGLGRARKR